MIKNNFKIVAGTGRLGRHETKDKDNLRIEALKFLLSEGCGLHISPTYDNSFKKLARLKEIKDCKNIICKIDFSRQSFPEIQLELTEELLKGGGFSVQIAGDIRNIISDKYSWKKFENYLFFLKKRYSIDEFFLSPLFHDSEYLLDLKKKSTLSFSLAVHYSLFESEFKNTLIKKKDKKNKLLALRAFGENINNFGNWYAPYGMEIKPKSLINSQIKEKNILLKKYNLEEKEARLIFALKNPMIDFACISFSNITQAKEALLVNKRMYDPNLLEDLFLLSSKSNFSRVGLGFKYPENTNYLSFYSFTTILKKGLQSNELLIFSLKNIFFKIRFSIIKIFKILYKIFIKKKKLK